MKRQLFAAAIAMMAAASAFAQQEENQFTVDAQLRTRGEHNHGAVTPRKDGQQAANFINERARLSMGWQRGDLEVKASVQHTGVWGQDGIKDANGRATMNEAWAKLHFGDSFFAQLGRQQLAYDDERILGTLDWNVNGNWHDALRLGYEQGHNKLHLIVAMNQSGENNRGDYYAGPMPYKSMQTLWYHYQSEMLPLGVSLMAINLGQEGGSEGHGRTRYMQTLGADFSLKPMNWNVHAAFYYQLGEAFSGQDVAAWMATAKVEYSFAPELGVNVGYDYLTGNHDIYKERSFNALYGTHHKFYGNMDLFAGTSYYGLHDIQAGLKSRIGDKLNAQLDYHYFMTAEEVRGHGKDLGHEVDLQLSYKLMRDVTLSGGYSFILSSETMDYLKGGSHDAWQDWAWVQLNIAPRVLLAKWK